MSMTGKLFSNHITIPQTDKDMTREEEPIAFTTEMTPKVDGGGIAFSLRSRDYKDAQCIAVQINGNYRAKRDCSEPNCREN